MFDIIVNGQVVAIVVESITKLIMKTLIDALPVQVSIEARVHTEPQSEATTAEETEITKA